METNEVNSSCAFLPAANFDPIMMVTDVFRRQLCNDDLVCIKCVCQDPVTEALISPIRQWLQDPKVRRNYSI